ncbi:MAG: RHS repeat-associated core domain-containing protein [Emcibacter sp.]|nr:RHS repeat-associated core domain-containing protein [Emcibacter sp.]
MGVELKTLSYTTGRTDVSIGPSGNGLSFSRSYNSSETYTGQLGEGWTHSFDTRAERSTTSGIITLNVIFGSSTQIFTRVTVGAEYESSEKTGPAVMSTSAGSLEEFDYKTRSGDIFYFKPTNSSSCADAAQLCNYYLDSITKIDGEKLTYSYQNVSGSYKLRSVNSSLGWNASIKYDVNWRISSVQMVNLAEQYCAPNYGSQPYCDLTNWPKVTYGYDSNGLLETITDTQSHVHTYVYTEIDGKYRLTGIRNPSAPSTNYLTINYSATDGKVTSQTVVDAGTWGYTRINGKSIITREGQNITYQWGLAAKPRWITDGAGRITTLAYGLSYRIKKQTAPDGSYMENTWDDRGNLTESKAVPISTSSLPAIVTKASYPSTCNFAAMPRCNSPDWTEDARGMRTDYTYATDGRVLTITSPPKTLGAVRGQQRFTYGQFQAYIKNSSGGYSTAGAPVYRLIETASCQTNAAPACEATADEVKTTYGYGPVVSSVGTNRALIEVKYDPLGLNRKNTIAYDRIGNQIILDGPLAGSNDTARILYDSERRVVGQIAPDPDGVGSLLHAATKLTYNNDGLLTTTEQGTVTNQTDNALTSFVSLQKAEVSYDGAGRPTVSKLITGTTTHFVTQTSYDTAGRVDCVAQRLNPAIYNSLPSSACTLGTAGTDGSDRISKTTYNNVSQVLNKYSAYGTALQQITAAFAYDPATGRLISVKDAKNNKTSYGYDGFGRQYQTFYPDPDTINTSSATDFDQKNLDNFGRLASVRKRDGQTIAFTYDDLGRVTIKDLPNTTAEDVYYEYNLFGQVLSLRHGSTSGNGIITTYNKAGQSTSINSYGRTISYQYDNAGRRNRMTWPDSFWVSYHYDVASRLTDIREYGVASGYGALASFTYDDLGHRKTLNRGNDADSTYDYDTLGRLTDLGHDLTGTTEDFEADFTYRQTSQIKNRNIINASVYGWTGVNVTEDYTFNGLNQLSTINSTTTSHDDNGNLTSDGSNSYNFDAENKLKTVGAGYSLNLNYDPAGRLRRTEVPGSSSTRTDFLYDGADMVAEYDGSGTVLRRYVHGPGLDAPLVWYEGASVIDSAMDRRWLHADERGSIIAVSDKDGTEIQTIQYDIYGVPSSYGGSRFLYTGQMALLEAELYYYKARIYSPSHGRFLQPDPIGYSGGMNLYAYVGGDPVNATDPWGLEGGPIEEIVVTGKRIVLSGLRGEYLRNFLQRSAERAMEEMMMQLAGVVFQTINEGFVQNKIDIKNSVCGGLLPALPAGALAEIFGNIKKGIDIKNALSEFSEGSILDSTAAFLTIHIGFYFEEKTGGNLDLKNQERYRGAGASRNAGNFNYGATGTALGFGKFKLTFFAHAYSIVDNFEFEGQMSIIHAGIAFTEIGCFE